MGADRPLFVNAATWGLVITGKMLEPVDDTGLGASLTRLDSACNQVLGQVHCGNLYVNRNVIGAVVGVQPFGGSDLSGTGPKAGGRRADCSRVD